MEVHHHHQKWITDVIPLPKIEVIPGIVAVGFYPYCSAHVREVLIAAKRGLYGGKPIDQELIDYLYGLREKLDEMIQTFQPLQEAESFYISVNENHSVIEWRMFGHKVYTWYTDGNIYIGTEINEWY